MEMIRDEEFNELFDKAGRLIENARNAIGSLTNMLTVYSSYQIGKYVVEQEQKGQGRAKYGSQVLESLSEYLSDKYGRGFSRTNIASMRKFYLVYKDREPQIVQSGIAQLALFQRNGIVQSEIVQSEIRKEWPFMLSWTHYQVLMRIDNADERVFYEKETYSQCWDVKTLKRQYHSSLYERLALSRNKSELLRLANEGSTPYKPQDILRTPYVLEFTGLEDKEIYHESDLEAAVLRKMQNFLLEMGKGFLFEKKQRRFVFNEKNYYLDLVLYNRYLRCYVLIDFKIDELTHQDLGQMQMYVNYYDRYEITREENPTIGILMCKEADKELVELTLPENSHIYAQEYKLYLPDKEVLQQKLHQWIIEELNEEAD